MDRARTLRFAAEEAVQVVERNFENAPVRTEPKPPASIGDDMRHIIVVQPLVGVDLGVFSILEPADTPTGVTDPKRTVGRRVETANRRELFVRSRSDLAEIVRADLKQDALG